MMKVMIMVIVMTVMVVITIIIVMVMVVIMMILMTVILITNTLIIFDSWIQTPHIIGNYSSESSRKVREIVVNITSKSEVASTIGVAGAE